MTTTGSLRLAPCLHVGGSRIHHNFALEQVQLGYGLHVGWAIEGAIGSKYKVGVDQLTGASLARPWST